MNIIKLLRGTLLIGTALATMGCAAGKQAVDETDGPRREVVMEDRPVSDTTTVIVVKQPPPARLTQIRPEQPTARHVWIPGRWAWHNDQYGWIKGKWVLSERDETVWIAGYWQKVRGGWVWVPGRWKDEPPRRQE